VLAARAPWLCNTYLRSEEHAAHYLGDRRRRKFKTFNPKPVFALTNHVGSNDWSLTFRIWRVFQNDLDERKEPKLNRAGDEATT
jgi:hypothetical protein